MHALILLVPVLVVVAPVVLIILTSLHNIGQTEVGLVSKRFGKKLNSGNIIAMDGEAGYQAELLMPGWRFKLSLLYAVDAYPWVQVPAGEIGVVIAQVGEHLPTGAKSAEYKQEFGDFTDLKTFLDNGGQKGIQRPVLPPGSIVPMHPVAFLVITRQHIYGEPVSEELPLVGDGRHSDFGPMSFGLEPEQLSVMYIKPEQGRDVMGIVTALEGQPLERGDIASRLGGYADIEAAQTEGKGPNEIIAMLLGTKNELHNNYQDFQEFLAHGGRIGLQHDPLLYGAYLLNPFLINVEIVPMTVVEQGEVAVIKSYVGLPADDTSGETFKFGSIVHPGHQGVWSDGLRTGKYPLNPRCYAAEIVPTSILTLNWAQATSEAHDLDSGLSAIDAKSREGFEFKIDLQVLIHVPDTKAPRVISSVGTMKNLVNEVLQSAVGNYFRNSLQQLAAIKFIETRNEVQEAAEAYITEYLNKYDVEVRGVYIQDVVLPAKLVEVLTDREIATQQKQTYVAEQAAQTGRIELENARGLADAQKELAQSSVEIDIAKNRSQAKEAEAVGAAAFTKATGEAEAGVIKAKGLAQAESFEKQREAIGAEATAAVAVIHEIAAGNVKITPDILVSGGGSSIDGLAATLIGKIVRDGNGGNGSSASPPAEEVPAATAPPAEAPAEQEA